MTWQNKFDRLLKAMASGEPPKRPAKTTNEEAPEDRRIPKRPAP